MSMLVVVVKQSVKVVEVARIYNNSVVNQIGTSKKVTTLIEKRNPKKSRKNNNNVTKVMEM